MNNKMQTSNKISIFYFFIADPSTKKEIGSFVNNSEIESTKQLNEIINKSKEILNEMSEKKQYIKSELNDKINYNNYTLYYSVISSKASKSKNKYSFYLAAIKVKENEEETYSNLVYELIKEIEFQGIRILVDKKGELTKAGRENLKFSIQKFEKSNSHNNTNNINTNTNNKQKDKQKDISENLINESTEIDVINKSNYSEEMSEDNKDNIINNNNLKILNHSINESISETSNIKPIKNDDFRKILDKEKNDFYGQLNEQINKKRRTILAVIMLITTSISILLIYLILK